MDGSSEVLLIIPLFGLGPFAVTLVAAPFPAGGFFFGKWPFQEAPALLVAGQQRSVCLASARGLHEAPALPKKAGGLLPGVIRVLLSRPDGDVSRQRRPKRSKESFGIQ